MRLKNIINHLVSSLLAQLLVSVLVILVLLFSPWGKVLRFAGLFQSDSEASRQFEQVAEALESNQGPSQGFDPILGPTGVPSPPSYEPPENSDESFSEESVIAGLMREFGFGDRWVQAPEWVPVYPGSIDKGTIRQSTQEGEKRIVSAAVPAMGSSVVSFYERAFKRMGCTFTNERNGSATSFAAESSDGARTITVAISARGGRSTFTLTYLQRSNLAVAPAAATPTEEKPPAAPEPGRQHPQVEP